MPQQNVTVDSLWREEWSGTYVRNHSLIDDPTVRVPGFDLPRQLWALLNRFRTSQGRCAANLAIWGQRDDPLCSCGQPQTMTHIVDECPLTKFIGGLRVLHTADDDDIAWLNSSLSIC
jgi:hypothetical protein